MPRPNKADSEALPDLTFILFPRRHDGYTSEFFIRTFASSAANPNEKIARFAPVRITIQGYCAVSTTETMSSASLLRTLNADELHIEERFAQ